MVRPWESGLQKLIHQSLFSTRDLQSPESLARDFKTTLYDICKSIQEYRFDKLKSHLVISKKVRFVSNIASTSCCTYPNPVLLGQLQIQQTVINSALVIMF